MAFFSWSRWFRSLLRPQVKPIQKRRTSLRMEELETRLAPAQFVWTGAGLDGKWATPTNWSGTKAPSPSDGLDDLVFQPGQGTTALNNNIGSGTSLLKINSLTFSGNGYTISGNGFTLGSLTGVNGQTGQINVNAGLTEGINLSMTLGGAGSGQQTFNIASGSTLTINGTLSGTAGAGWTKVGRGTMVLSADNTPFTGAFTASQGVTQLRSGTALGSGAQVNNTVTVQAGAQLQLSSPTSFTVSNHLRLNGAGLASTGPTSGALLDVSGNNTWAGPIELDSDTTLGAGTQGVFTITGAAETGTTVTITTTANVNFLPGQYVTIFGISQVQNGFAVDSAYQGTFIITGVSGNTFTYTDVPGLTNAPVLSSNATATAGTKLTISGSISDAGAGHNLTKEGIGILDLTAANTYRGTTSVNNGVLRVENNQALGTGPGFRADNGTSDAITVNTNFSSAEVGTLQLVGPASGNGLSIANKLLVLNGPGYGDDNRGSGFLGALDNLQGNNTWTGNVILGSQTPIGSAPNIETDGNAPYYTLTISGVVSDPYQPGLTLTKTGLGILDFTNSNTYTGVTNVQQGILEIQDSQALGQVGKFSPTYVFNGATLELAVDNQADSVTKSRNSKNVSDPLFIWGPGAPAPNGGFLGALYSQSGVNTYSGTITVSDVNSFTQNQLTGAFVTWVAPLASIGVAADPNPTNTANYLTNDYSLTVTGNLLGAWNFNQGVLTKPMMQKFGAGDLILPVANPQFTGPWQIRQGWVTVEDSQSLGHTSSTVAQNDEPTVTIDAGAALHLYDTTGNGITLRQNFYVAGNGLNSPTATFSEIVQQGAIENLGGVNSIVGNILLKDQQTVVNGNIVNNPVGIGVEQVFGASQLKLSGTITDQPVSTYVRMTSGTGANRPGFSFSSTATGPSSGSSSTESAAIIQTGSTSGSITVSYNMFQQPIAFDGVPDTLDVYYGIFGEASAHLIGTVGYVFGGGNLTVNYGPLGSLSSTYISVVANQGGNLNGASAWTYTANITPDPTPAAGIVKEGSGLLDIVGQGTYTGGVDIKQGVVLDQNSLALGMAGKTPGTVTVEGGAALGLANSTAFDNGGLKSGIQVAGEHLIVNGDPTIQTVTINGSLAGTAQGVPYGTFALTFNGQTTGLLSTVIPASGGTKPTDSLQNALMALSTIGTAGGTVTVTQSGDVYTVKFGGTLAGKVQPALQVASVTAGTNVIIGTGLGNTSLGAPVAPFGVWGSATSEWNPAATLVQANANYLIPTDDQWNGPITLNVSTPIDVPASSRLTLSGSIDDAGNTSATGSDLLKIGTGELVLAGANTYHGTTYVGSSGNPASVGFDPDNVNEFFTAGGSVAGGVVTVSNSQALGTAGTPTVQTVTLTGAVANKTAYSLTFNGKPTTNITYTGVPATDATNLQNALNALTNVGGSVAGNITVSSASAGVLTVTFGGSFVGFSQTQMIPLIVNGQGTISVAVTSVGTGGVVVQNGSALQLQGNITVAGKTLEMSGTGFDPGAVPLAAPNWTPTGPTGISNGPTLGTGINATAPTSGRVTGIAVDPNDPNTLYISTAGGGVWKTQNAGQTWTPLFDNTASEFSGAVAVAPSNSQVMYVGTGEADGSSDSYAGTGVYTSTDGGHTWSLVTNTATGSNPIAGLAVSKIAVDPGNPNIIFVATSDLATNAVSSKGKVGVWRFDGTTWTNLTSIVSQARGVAGGPKDPGPDDNFIIGFPQQNVTWSDLAVVGTGANAVLFAALGTPGGTSYVSYKGGAPTDVNAVYFAMNPESAGTTWYLGDGKVDGETATVDFPQVANAGNIKISAVVVPNPFAGPPNDIRLQPNVFKWQEIAVYAAYESAVPATAGQLAGVMEGLVTSGKGVFYPPPPQPPPNGNFGFLWTALAATLTPDTTDNYSLAIMSPGSALANFGMAGPGNSVYVGTQNNLQFISGGASFDVTVDSTGAAPAAGFHALAAAGQNAALFAGTDGGVWSLNTLGAANTWSNLNTNINDTLITSISASPSTNTLVASTQSSGIIEYTGGTAWTVSTVGAGLSPLANTLPYGSMVEVNPNNPLNMFAFVTNTSMSIPDGIVRPNPIIPPGPLPPVGSVVPSSVLLESNDGGQTWNTLASPDYFPSILQPSFTLSYDQNANFALDQVNPDRIMVPGTNTNNVLFPLFFWNQAWLNLPLVESLDGGQTFRIVNTPSATSVERVALATYQGPFQPDPAFPHVTDQGSNNDVPSTFYVIDDALNTDANFNRVAGIFITRDYGATWSDRTSNLPSALLTLSSTNFGPQNSFTKNAGDPANESVSTSNISDMVVDPTNSNVIYLLNSGPSGMNIGRVFKSANGGLTWTAIGGVTGDGLPDVPAWKLTIDPRSGTLYVGTDQGAYSLSSAASSTWAPVGTGLPQVQIKDIYVNSQTDTLIAATYGRGVWTIPLNPTQSNAGALTSIAGTGQWAGPVVLTGATTLSAGGTQALGNDLSADQLAIFGTISDLSGTQNNDITIGTAKNQGTVTFTGANTYTGTTEVANGVLIADNLTALGGTTNGTIVDNGAALGLLSSVDAEPLILNGDGPSPGLNGHQTGSLESIANVNTYAGQITLASSQVTIGVASGSTLTITGEIDGNANLIKELTGTLALAEPIATPNTYTGETFVYQGALQIQSPVALAASAGTMVLDGAQIQLFSTPGSGGVVVSGETLDLSGTGINNTGALLNVGGSNTWDGPIILDAAPGFSATTYPVGAIAIAVGADGAAADPTDVLTISGAITEAQPGLYTGIVKIGPDQLVLTNTNSYNGTTFINNGVVRITNAQSLGDPSNNPIQRVTVYDPGQAGSFTLSLTIDGVTQSTNPILSGTDGTTMATTVTSELNNLLTNMGVDATVNVQPAAVTLTGSTNKQIILSIMFQGAGLAGLNLPQLVALATGGATVVESKVADLNAGTEVAAGAALQLDLANNGQAGQTVTESAQLNGTGPNGGGAIENVSGANTWSGPITLATSSGIGVDVNGGLPTSLNVNGDISGPSSSSLTVLGGGTLALSHANDYQGTTIVQAGILSAQNNGALGGPLTDEVQTITITGAITGTYRLSFGNQTTQDISADATAAQVQTALSALNTIGTGNVLVNLSPAGTVYTVTFVGALAGRNQPPLTLSRVSVGTEVDLATITDGGLGNTIVNSGATLQLSGGVNISTEQVLLSGNGVNGNGALESVVGANSWDPNSTPISATDPTIPDSSIILVGSTTIGVDTDPGVATPGLLIDQTVTGAGSLTKIGSGTLEFTGSTGNSYTGGTTVADGTLLMNKVVTSITSISETSNVVTVTTSSPLSPSAVGQPVTIFGVATIGYNGTFTVTSVNGNTFTYTNSDVNLPSDATGTVAFVDIPNNLTIGDGTGNLLSAVGRIEQIGQIPASATLTVNGDGLFDPNSLPQAVGALNMTGGTIDLSQTASSLILGGNLTATSDASGNPATILTGLFTNGTFSLGGATRTFTINAGIQAPLSIDMLIETPVTATGTESFIKNGSGRLALTADSTGSLPNAIQLAGGDLQADGSVGEVDVTGGSVSGTGAVGVLAGATLGTSVAGTVSPGDNGSATGTTGILNSNAGINAEFWGPGTIFSVDLVNATDINGLDDPGVGYDQLVVNGNLDLGGATLAGMTADTVKVNDTFTILKSVGGVITGQFADPLGVDPNTGLPIAYVGGSKFNVKYIQNGNGDVTQVQLIRVKQVAAITVTPSTLSPVYGQDVTYTAHVTIDGGAGSAPPGTKVTFILDKGPNQLTQDVPVVNGIAVFDPAAVANLGHPLPVGQHTIDATYDGVVNISNPALNTIDPVSAPQIKVTVNKGQTLTTESLSSTYMFGQTILITATVAPKIQPLMSGQSVPSNPETVTFSIDGGNPSTGGFTAVATLDTGGHASINLTSVLGIGTHTIAVGYNASANPNYLPSSSTTQTFTITKDISTLTLTSSVGTSVYGQPVTFTATVSTNAPGTASPTGSVSFFDGTTLLGTATLSPNPLSPFNAAASLQVSLLTVGNHTITASYGGTPQLQGSSGALSPAIFVVNQDSTTTVLTANPAGPWGFSQPVIFTAHVLDVPPGQGGTPTGNVFFFDKVSGSPVLLATKAVDSSGQAIFQISTLPAGPHQIYATYSGSTNFLPSPSNEIDQIVLYGSTTTVSSSQNPINVGTNITITAVVTGATGTPQSAGVPSGTVTFTDTYTDPTGAQSVTILAQNVQLDVTGTASVTTTSPFAVGSHAIAVVYTPGANAGYSGSNATLLETVRSNTTTTLSTSVNPSPLGSPLTIIATLAPVAPGTGIPTGTVNFFDNLAFLGSVTVSDTGANPGQAVLTTKNLIKGTHNLTASYVGNLSYAASNSNTVTENVLYASTTTVASSKNPATANDVVNFTATVHAAKGTPTKAGVPTGTVNFYDGATYIGTAALNTHDQAILSIGLGVGVHNITATYSGSTNYAGSTSPIVVQNINSISQTVITSSDNPALYGEAVTFTATVTATSPGAPPVAGTVTFKNGSLVLGTVPVSGGQATFTLTSKLTLGNHSITATYTPAAGTAIATSAGSMTETIQVTSTTTSLSSNSPSSVFGQQVTLTATVASNASPLINNLPAPTGSVTFVDTTTGLTLATVTLTNGTAKLTRGNLNVGTHNIVATYNPGKDPQTGTVNYTTSNASTTQQVSQAQTTTTISSSGNPGPAGGAVTITATVTAPGSSVSPQGTVNFIDPNTGIPYPNASNVPVAVNGTASFILSGLVFGNAYDIQANFTSVNGNFSNSSDSLVETVLNGTSTQVVLTAPTQPTSTDFVTFTAVVAPLDNSLPIPSGNVQFMSTVGGVQTVLGSASIDTTTGDAVFTTSTTLPAGVNLITAEYEGDGSFFAPSIGTTNVNVFDTPTQIAAAITSPAKGTVITPAVAITITAKLFDANNQPVTVLPNGGTATITLIQGGGLTGSHSAQFINGKFVFSNLHVTTSGTYIVEIDFAGLSTQITFNGSGRLS
jgi:autotransporter-associated beta strand protein